MTTPGHNISLREATKVWLRIGLLSFGGPAGQIALMHRMLVEERKWIGEGRFLHALNYCMLLPGPEAQQLATYVGWLMHRTLGGVIAGVLFVLPGALVIGALSAIYALYGATPLVEALFYGMKPVVLAIVVEALLRVARRALAGPAMVALAAVAFLAMFAFAVPFPIVVLGAGLVGYVGGRIMPSRFGAIAAHGGSGSVAGGLLGDDVPDHARPSRTRAFGVVAAFAAIWGGPVLALWLLAGPQDIFTQLALFFSQMAVVTFGGAYAVLAYVAQAAVEQFGWLQPGEMLDGLALAETTPGPLILVLEFVGFLAALRDSGGLPPLLAGVLGAIVTLWVTFAPSFLWIFLGGPYIERLRGNRLLSSGLAAITAAVVGVILNLALWFTLHVVFAEVGRFQYGPIDLPLPNWTTIDPVALLLAVLAAIVLLRGWLKLLPTLALGATLGLAIRFIA